GLRSAGSGTEAFSCAAVAAPSAGSQLRSHPIRICRLNSWCGRRFLKACRETRLEGHRAIRSVSEVLMTAFKTIRARAEKRKGGPGELKKLLPGEPDMKALKKLADDRVLAEMTQRVFSAGFAWSVIEAKWDGFEEAFLGFEPRKLVVQNDD